MNFIASKLCFNTLLFAVLLHFSIGNDVNFTGRNWAILIAGSKGWSNYRHQADVCHAYQLLRKHGVPPENIITFMYNDIANNTNNPYPGKIFNSPEKIDVYKGVVVDYEGNDVLKRNFMNVLLGDEEAMKGVGSGRVLKSGPGDNVFVYYSDHGNEGIVTLPNYAFLSYDELLSTLETMHKNKQFEKLLFYMEACHSGSMFKELPNNINVYATTASNANENSWACHCHVDSFPCLGDVYSVSWMENTEEENVNKFTVKQQFEVVKDETTRSEVCQFGDIDISKDIIGDFFGSLQPRSIYTPDSIKKNRDLGVVYPSAEHDFHYLHKQLNESEHGSAKHKEIVEKINSTLVDMKHVKERMEIIARVLSPTTAHYDEIITARHEIKREHGRCFSTILESLINACFETEFEKEHIFKHTQKVINMCSQAHLTEDQISQAINFVCTRMEYEKVDLEDMEGCWMGQNICNILCSAKGKQHGSCTNIENKCICE